MCTSGVIGKVKKVLASYNGHLPGIQCTREKRGEEGEAQKPTTKSLFSNCGTLKGQTL